MSNFATMFDADTQLKDAGLVAASAAATVASAARIIDFKGPVMTRGVITIDVTAIEVASGDEGYQIEWQLSDSATFASNINVAATLKLGDSSVANSSADNTTGRYHMCVNNDFGGTVFQYARLYTRVAGTIATGINYSAFLSPDC